MMNAQQGSPRRAKLEVITPISGIDDRFRAIFDAVKDGIFITDPRTGQFIEINEPGCAMFGYDVGDLIGRNIALLSSGIYPSTQEVAIENCERLKREGAQTFEWQCRKKNGALLWTEISRSYAEIGDIPVVVAVIRDITARKQQEKELLVAHQKMAAANEAKSAFLANMSHELRTPLNAIIGFSEMILKDVMGRLEHARYREYIGDIRESGLHLLALINDVLDLSRLDAGMAALSEEDVDLHRLIADACRMVMPPGTHPHLQITNNAGRDVPHVRGDEPRIKQIVLNLLSNAVKFTPDSGAVTVTAKETREGLRLRISDTGIGIAEEDLKKVLDRFGQIDNTYSRKYQGSGLGLPLTKRLIELHGGTLGIESKLGAGTSVSVTFPVERVIRKDGDTLVPRSTAPGVL